MTCPVCNEPPGPEHVHHLPPILNPRYFCPQELTWQDGWYSQPVRHEFDPKDRCNLCGYRIRSRWRDAISRLTWRVWGAIFMGGRDEGAR